MEQALEFGLGRCGDAVETGRFVIERVGAIDEEHVQVGVRFSAEPKRWMRVTAPVRTPAPTRNPARRITRRPGPVRASTILSHTSCNSGCAWLRMSARFANGGLDHRGCRRFGQACEAIAPCGRRLEVKTWHGRCPARMQEAVLLVREGREWGMNQQY